MNRHGIAIAVVLLATIGMGKASLEKKALDQEVPSEMREWSFMTGDWVMKSKRYSLDGPVIEENDGTSRIALTMRGWRLEERQSTSLGGKPMMVLNVLAYHPESKQWQASWTDSLHNSFNLWEGTGDDKALVFHEKNPDPGSQVARRVTYVHQGKDTFSRLLEFSLDDGKTWLKRNETIYTRRN